jgi:hypothetical protein
MNLPVEVIEAVRGNRCLLFVGSRASAEAAELADERYPEAGALARDLGWRKPKPIPGQKPKPVVPSVTEGAAAYEASNGRAALVGHLREQLAAPVPPSPAHGVAVRRFPLSFTTAFDDLLERAAADADARLDVLARGDRIPDPEPGRATLVRLRGELARPDTLLLTRADFAARPLGADVRKQMRTLLRNNVVFFVGYRPDEEEFELLFEELSECYGGELPRCHMAVAQSSSGAAIDDYLWQKWVWRGLLLFTADPAECLEALGRELA